MITNRFKDFEWCPDSVEFQDKYEDMLSVVLGGAGGISSWTYLFLTRIGYTVFVIDFDRIEQHNLGGQFFKNSQVGLHKVEALVTNAVDFGANIYDAESQVGEFARGGVNAPVMICGFDNMRARRDFYETWKYVYHAAPNAIFIDGRLTAEMYQIFTIRGTDYDRMEKYEAEYLFGDEEVEDGPCTMKQTSHIAAMIGGNITGILTNHIANTVNGSNIRVIPFYVNYMSTVQMLETKVK